MAVAWLILKGIGWLLLVILALLIAALLVPVTAELCYEQGKFTAALRVLAVRVKLYPRPEKPAKPKKKKKPRKRKKGKPAAAQSQPAQTVMKETEKKTVEPAAPPAQKAQTEGPESKKAAPQPAARPVGKATARPPQKKAGKAQPQPQPEKTLQETVDWVLSWLRTGGQILRRLLEGFKIHHIRIYLPVHRETAASTALAVGAVHAGLGASFGMLQNFLDLRMEQMVIEPDYTGEHQGQEHFSCKITSHLIIMVITGVWALLRLRREKLI